MNSQNRKQARTFVKTSGSKKQHNTHGFSPSADRTLKQIFGRIGTPDPQPFVPDEFQVQALESILDADVLVSAPTGAGKTWIAAEAIRRLLADGKRAWYASPLKALSNSKYIEFSDDFGRDRVGIITGDRKENTDAQVIVGTTEILRNQLYDAMARSDDFRTDLVILDEAHYLGDTDRGVVWEEIMIYLPRRVRLLLLSATIANDAEIAGWLESIRRHPCRVVHSDERPVPIYPLYLLPSGEILPLSGKDGISKKIEQFFQKTGKGRFRHTHASVSYDRILSVLEKYDLLPAVFFLKSRIDCNNALYSCRNRVLNEKRRFDVRTRVNTLLHDYSFLSDHPQCSFLVNHGLGSHHGGQLPHWKIVVEKLMQEGYLDAIFSTSTVAAGVNFPARTVVLVQSDRFNGKEFVSLTSTELHQATGRAGRRGKDNVGFALMVHGPYQDPHLVRDLFNKSPEPILSQIKINFSMCLNLLLSQSPTEIKGLLEASFATYQNIIPMKKLEKRYRNIMNRLKPMLQNCFCETAEEITARIHLRQDGHQRLHRLYRKKKKHLKAIARMKLSTGNDIVLDDIERSIASVKKTLAGLPCDSCQNIRVCHNRHNSAFSRDVRDASGMHHALDEAQNALWRNFENHIRFLTMTGFVDSMKRLTEDGLWASRLRLDQPLIIAEMIRKNTFRDSTPQLLAGLIAVFVSDKYRDIEMNAINGCDTGTLRTAFNTMQKDSDDIIRQQKSNGFQTPLMQFWPAAALFMWACGKSWDDVIRSVQVDEGDLAMLIYRTADNLRQLTSLKDTHPVLAEKASAGIRLILREPVILPT